MAPTIVKILVRFYIAILTLRIRLISSRIGFVAAEVCTHVLCCLSVSSRLLGLLRLHPTLLLLLELLRLKLHLLHRRRWIACRHVHLLTHLRHLLHELLMLLFEHAQLAVGRVLTRQMCLAKLIHLDIEFLVDLVIFGGIHAVAHLACRHHRVLA